MATTRWVAGVVKSIFDSIITYDTPKQVLIKNIWAGVCYRLVQILIFTYLIGYLISSFACCLFSNVFNRCRYVMIWQKGYQESETAFSSVTSKVKGVAFTGDLLTFDAQYRRIWDP